MSELALYIVLNNKGVASIWRALSPANNTRLKTEIKRPYTMKVTYGSCHIIYHTIPMSKTAHNILAQLSKYFPLSPTCTIQLVQNLQRPQHVL